MKSQTLARSIAAGAILAAAVLVLVARMPSDSRNAATDADTPPPARLETAASGGARSAAESREAPAAVRARELEAMSETYRNTTFLIAIRDAGFVCHELLRVYGALDDSPKWTATCSDMLSYTVGVTADGALSIDPMLQYIDGLAPSPEPSLPPQPPRPLPPQRR